MSYTTNRQPQGRAKSAENFLREGMIAEIVAIDDYSKFISLTDNKELKELFHHIREDEKEHYGLFLEALRKIDIEEADAYKEAQDHVKISPKDKCKEGAIKDNRGNLLINIREAIKGELEAILLYEDFICSLNDNALIRIIEHIIRDEKEHVEELTIAMLILDKEKYGPLK